MALLGLSLLSCGREITGPNDGVRGTRRTASFALAPRFTGPFAGSSLVSDLVPFERVRVVLRRLDGSVAKDTVVLFPPNADSVALTLVVPIPASADPLALQFALTMRYINAAGDTVFSGGPVTVQGVPTGGGAPPTAVEIPVTYSGTGASATSVQVTPDSGAVLAGSTTQFSALARDAANAVIANTPVLFTSPDPTRVTVTADGLATWLPVRGAARVVGTLLTGQAADTVVLTVTLPPTQLLLVSGGDQSAMVGQALVDSLVFRVAAADGLGVSGREVTFVVSAGGGTITTAVDTSDADGLVSTKWTLGSLLGAQTVTATATGIAAATQIVTATGTAPLAVRTAFTSVPTSVVAGATFTPNVVVEVHDASGNLTLFSGPVSVALDAGATGATLDGTATVNAVDGVATFGALSITKAASGLRLIASSAGLESDTSATFDITPAAPVFLGFAAGNGQTGTVAQPLADSVAAMVLDVFTNPVPGQTVNFSVTNGGGSVSPTTGVTGADGIARSQWTLGPTVVLQEVRAELNGFPLIFSEMTATTVAGSVSELSVVTAPADASAGASLGAVAVEATDALGNRVVNFNGNVSIAIDSGPPGATLSGSTSVTAFIGVANFSGLSLDVAGTYRLRFTAAGLTDAVSAPFSVTPASAMQLVWTQQVASATATIPMASGWTVEAHDAFGNVVPGYAGPVSVTLAGGDPSAVLGGTTTRPLASGTVAFDDLTVDRPGIGYTLTAAGSGVSSAVSAPFPVATAAIQWINVAGGNWSEASNWDLGRVPMAFDSVVIGASGTYTVTVDANPTVGSIHLGGASGVQTLVADGVTVDAPDGFVITAAGVLRVAGVSSVNAPVTIAASATLEVGALAGQVVGAALTVSGGLTNSGTLVLTNNSNAAGWDATLAVTGGSLVNLAGGVLDVLPGITGSGPRTISATLDNQGTLAVLPGASGGTVDLTGSLTNSGAITVDVSPAGSVLLAVTGAVTLGGTLNVTVFEGYVPPNGSSFTFLTHTAARTGTFSTVNVPPELSAALSYLANAVAVDAAVGPGARLGAGTSPVNVQAGDTAPTHSVTVRDAGGTILTAATGSVTVSVDSGPAGGTILGTTTVSIASGVASFSDHQFTVAGDYRLRYSSAGLADTVSSIFTVSPAAPNALVILSGNGQSVPAFQPAPDSLRVRLEDTFGNGIPATLVNFVVTAGDPTASPATVLTDASGIAAAELTMGGSVGGYTVEATSSGVLNAVFTGSTLSTLANMVWTGNVSSSLTDPANWASNTIPVSVDSILIPAGRPNYPVLTSDIQVAWATIEPGATVNVGNFFLGLTRGLDAPTSASIVADTGGIVLDGVGGTVRGRMPKLYVLNGAFLNDGPLVVDSVLIAANNGTMSFGTSPVTVGLDLITTASGTIAMLAGSSVSVGRNALFDGGSTLGQLTGGTLSVVGDFVTTATGDAAAFSANAAHVVDLVGTATQTVQLAFPDVDPVASCSGSCFGTLRSLRSAGQGVVNFTTDAKALGALEITGDGLNAPGRTILGGGTPNLTATTVVAAKIGWQTGLLRSASFTVDTLIAWGNNESLIAGETIPTRVAGGVMLLSGSHPAPIVIDGISAAVDVVGAAQVGTGAGDALITLGSGGLHMTDAADSLRLNGNARFGGTSGALTAGVLEVTGDFTQETGSATFVASAGHRLRLLGTAPTLTIATSVLNTIGVLDLQAISAVTLNGARTLGDVIVGPSVSVVGGADAPLEIGGSLIEPIGGRWQLPNTVFNGVDPSLPGSINGNVTFADSVALDTAFVVSGDLTIQGGTLDLNGNRLDVGGSFNALGATAVLRMAAAADTMSILGEVLFSGATTDGQLTNGLLELLGNNFTASGDPSSFAPSGAHVTRFGAGNIQTAAFANPGFGAGTQHFANLVIAQSGVGTELQLLSHAFVDGTVASEPGNSGKVAGVAPLTLTARGANLASVPFQGVTLDLVDGAAIVALDSLTFTDQDPTVVQLTITRPAGSFTLSSPTFSTVPTTGRYLRVVDSDEGTDLFVNVTDPTPSGHGGFVDAFSGATVTGWPASVATQLVLTTAAAGATSGAAFTTQPVIEVRDAGGALIANDNSTLVTVTATAGVTVIGTASATAVGGVVTFSDVGLSGDAGTYDLTYSAAGLDSTTQQIVLGGPPAPVITWTGSVDNSWATAGNWDLNRLPVPTDSAVINVTDTVTVTTAAQVGWLTVGEAGAPTFTIGAGATLTIDSLAIFGGASVVNMTGGTLTGDGSATILGTLNWSGGTMAGNGVTLIAASATATVTGAPTLNTRGLIVGGTLALAGTGFNGSNVVGETPTLAVLDGGILTFTSTTSYFSGNGIVEVVNSGTMRKGAAAGLVRVDWPIVNTGTFEIEDDSLDLRNTLTHIGGTISIAANAELVSNGDTDAAGSITIAAGGVLTLQSGGISADAGNHIFGPTSSVTGPGKLRVNSADTTRIQGVLDIDSLTVQNGNTWFEGPDTMYVTDGTYLGGGFFRGSGVLGIRGNFVLNAGNIVGTGGTLAVRPGATLALRGMSGWNVDVEGTATWGDYDMTFSHDTLNGVPFASLRVRPGGLLDVLHGATTPRELFALGSATYPNVVFTIDAGAVVRKSTGSGVSNFRPRFEMAGTFDVLSGTINIQGTCAMSGSKTGVGAVTGSCGSFP